MRAHSRTRRAAFRSATSARCVLAHVQRVSEPRERLIHYLRHIGRYVPAAETEPLARPWHSGACQSDLELPDGPAGGGSRRNRRAWRAPAAGDARVERDARRITSSTQPTALGMKPADVGTPRRQQAARIAGDLRLRSRPNRRWLALFDDAKTEASVRVAARGAPCSRIDRAAAARARRRRDRPTRRLRRRCAKDSSDALAAGGARRRQPYLAAVRSDAGAPRLRERVVYALAGNPAGRPAPGERGARRADAAHRCSPSRPCTSDC